MKRKTSRLDDEGVTHYRLEFQKAPAPAASLTQDLTLWRNLFHRLQWMGQDPHRYRGVGFGNVSRRLNKHSEKFIVSATQTGKLPLITSQHYSVVIKCDPYRNSVTARGIFPPSSESMTHAIIYRLDPEAQFVIHVHAPEIWNAANRLKLLSTGPRIAYGTPEMAQAVEHLFKSRDLSRQKLFVMKGHRDGVVSFGKTAEEAGMRLIRRLLVS